MHKEGHRTNHTGWLRAAVLGANDGLLSTSSLVLGVAAAHGTPRNILIAGTAGMVAGAMSMASGEYVSVYSQADVERADLNRERAELAADPIGERDELRDIYISRGLNRALAEQVAMQLMKHDPLEAHARDELGITEELSARPMQAALASAASFAAGAIVPILVSSLVRQSWVVSSVVVSSLLCLAILGALAARVGGADLRKGAIRVVFWGLVAMAITFITGAIFGTRV